MILDKYYFKKIKYNLINKFLYKKINLLPKIEKIKLNFTVNTVDMKKLFSLLLALELVINQKAKLKVTKKLVLKLQIQKGNPIYCNLIIKKQILYKVFNNLILKVIPKLKKNGTKFNLQKNRLFFEIYDVLNFSELKKHYSFFNNLFSLNIKLLINVSNTKQLVYFCKLFQIVL